MLKKILKNINSKFLAYSLIELMVVLAIVGILGSVTIPVYSDYLVRSKVSEALVVFDKLKKMSLDFYNIKGRFPQSLNDLELTSDSLIGSSQYIEEVYIASILTKEVSISVTFKDTVGISKEGAGSGTLSLLSNSTNAANGGIITWSCSSKTIIKKHLPSNCNYIPASSGASP